MDWDRARKLLKSFWETKKEEYFEEFIKLCSNWFLSLAYNILRNTDDAKDAFQNFSTKLWNVCFQNKEFPSSFKSWLTRIAINETISLYRKRKRQQKLEARLAERAFSTPVDTNPVEKEVEDKHTQQKIKEAILSLDEEKRTAFVLVALEGYSYKEAAEILGVSENQIRGRVYQARKILRKKLADLLH